MKLKNQKLGIAVLGLALFMMASLPNQAKAFTVNDNDLYLILSNNTTEYYLDLGNRAAVLAAGGIWNVSSGISTAGGVNPTHWAVAAANPLGAADSIIISNQKNNLNGTLAAGSVANGMNQWVSFESNAGPNPTDMTLAQGNSNSYYNLFDGAGITPGTFNQTTSTAQSVNGTVGLQTQMSLYRGDLASNVLTLLTAVATLTGSPTGGYTFAITLPSVPLPPSMVMFVTGLIALALIARRKQARV